MGTEDPMIQKGYALLFGGGTSAPIDGVRSMTNDAEGDIAVAFAWSFAKLGVRCVLGLSRLAYYKHRDNLPKDAVAYVFKTFSEYVALIDTILVEHGKPAWALSMVAVNDYGYLDGDVPKGKMSSATDALTLTIPALPKVLDTWRGKMGRECVIVGFKFLTRANASLYDLFDAARRQNARAHLNGTVGNFKEEIGGGKHPVWWITPDGGTLRLDGWRGDVTDQLAKILVRYAHTTWHRSVRVESDGTPHHAAVALAHQAIHFAQDAGLLTGPEGNIAVRAGDGVMLVSPRGVDKSAMRAEDLLVARLDRATREVCFYGPVDGKPSIDSSVHLSTMGSLRHPVAIHFHGGWVLGSVPRTRLAYPCGTLQQARNIEEAVAHWQQETGTDWNGPATRQMLELRDHGHILYVRDVTAVAIQWESARAAYHAHLVDIGRPDLIEKVALQPVWLETEIVGVTALMDGLRSFFLIQDVRGLGLGEQLVELVNRRGTRIAAHDRCKVVDFYRKRGFKTVERREAEGLLILDPPSVRDDLRDAATVCLHCTTTDRLLLALRSPDVSYGGLYCHLGGKIDPDDRDFLATIVREPGEEGGLDLEGLTEPAPGDVTVHYTGYLTPDGREVGTRVTNVLVRTVVELAFVPDGSEIVGGGWFDRAEAARLPMGPATRAVLRKVWPDL
ncbi:hypothetical protein A2348_04130 [Candidatus Uhrbacteria bacterium RIFOXYB12_FULL_58_10]|uniref:Nudix hydrolase domain-containing protein n=1 Tax=Candidatus Uhrbacteria bacterium RIFOXYB2_FULL_57_15 TaxID=1802422 RepID=A0A1F7W507_9BACT|nr:MAG: hypothetical protein A2348_04130 [Candidatus Uhrbacteria bacterium RIFOXYB12_FULL_58_10]OGL97892.1 MAG: hypothetical protein A2304_03120 [Candidatus Uhrbacteria bacterium RIFOXYB2_FULL_57_15]OGL98923.1 MAG: hypothetical protein A2501_02200 [Candidatus Uhrbacteria bacterium RIFOXYC12_FULL_57_11]